MVNSLAADDRGWGRGLSTRLVGQFLWIQFSDLLTLLLSRQTMIVTTEYCEVLYVEADHMRRIYEVTLHYAVLHTPLTNTVYIVHVEISASMLLHSAITNCRNTKGRWKDCFV